MSYAIVKGLKIDAANGKVWLKASANNVSPRTYDWWHCESLSKILNQEGKEALEKEILLQYWNGNFQKSNNLYDRAVMFYKNKLPFTWDNTGDKLGKDWLDRDIKYTYDELKDALYEKYLAFKNRPKMPYFVKYNGNLVRKKTARYIFYAASPERAKRFNSYEDAVLFAGNLAYKGNIDEMVIPA